MYSICLVYYIRITTLWGRYYCYVYIMGKKLKCRKVEKFVSDNTDRGCDSRLQSHYFALVFLST